MSEQQNVSMKVTGDGPSFDVGMPVRIEGSSAEARIVPDPNGDHVVTAVEYGTVIAAPINRPL